MPRIKKLPASRVTYRRMVTLTESVAARVEALAKEQQRSTAGMLRILIERAIVTK